MDQLDKKSYDDHKEEEVKDQDDKDDDSDDDYDNVNDDQWFLRSFFRSTRNNY